MGGTETGIVTETVGVSQRVKVISQEAPQEEEEVGQLQAGGD